MPNEKILVVDDDTNICELLRLYLEKEGYVVKIVNDGVSAIKEGKGLHPGLAGLLRNCEYEDNHARMGQVAAPPV